MRRNGWKTLTNVKKSICGEDNEHKMPSQVVGDFLLAPPVNCEKKQIREPEKWSTEKYVSPSSVSIGNSHAIFVRNIFYFTEMQGWAMQVFFSQPWMASHIRHKSFVFEFPDPPPSQFPKAAALNCYTFHTGQQGDTHVWQVQDENYLWASLSFLQLIALEMKFHWPTASGQTVHTGGWEPTFFSANLLRRWKTISKYGAKWTVGASQHKTNSWGRVNSHRIFTSQSAEEDQGLDLTALKVDNKTKWFTTKIRHQTSGNSQPKRRAVSFLAKGC